MHLPVKLVLLSPASQNILAVVCTVVVAGLQPLREINKKNKGGARGRKEKNLRAKKGNYKAKVLNVNY